MESEGCPFRGCLYFGLMLTASDPKVIEYNCRFGDPEAQVLLSMLETDLLEIMLAVHYRTLADTDIQWKPGAAACIVIASGGYPGRYDTGLHISELDECGGVGGASVYHAGTKWDGAFMTFGGRVLGVTVAAKTLDPALEAAYLAVERISFEGDIIAGILGDPLDKSLKMTGGNGEKIPLPPVIIFFNPTVPDVKAYP